MATERRRKQVARRIRERVAQLFLHEVKDPRAAFITVTEVDVNSDMTLAKIRYTVLGTDSERKRVASWLRHAHGFLRTEVAHAVQLRSAPQVVFEYDEGIERADRIARLLGEVLPKEDAGVGPDAPTADGDDAPAD